MLSLIGFTLAFAGLTSALGIPRALLVLRTRRPRPAVILPLVTHIVMSVWFFAAGIWAMFSSG